MGFPADLRPVPRTGVLPWAAGAPDGSERGGVNDNHTDQHGHAPTRPDTDTDAVPDGARHGDAVLVEVLLGLVACCRAAWASLSLLDPGGAERELAVAGRREGPDARHGAGVRTVAVPGDHASPVGVLRLAGAEAADGAEAAGGAEAAAGAPDHEVIAAVATLLGQLLLERRTGRLPAAAAWGAAVVDAAGCLRLVSPTICRSLGYEPLELLDRAIFDVIHPDDLALAADSLARTATVPGEKYPLDVRFLRRDGGSEVIEVLAEDRPDAAAAVIVFRARPVSERPVDDALTGEQVRVLDMIGRGEPVDATLGEIARLAGRRLGTRCAVLVAEGGADPGAALRVVAGEGIDEALWAALDGEPVGPGSNTCGLAVHVRSAARGDELWRDPAWRRQHPALAAAGIQSCWADPIVSSRDTAALGTLAFLAGPGWAPTAADVRAADLFAALASVALQRAAAEAELQHRARHDPLTGLPNRALFLERLDAALAARRGPDEQVAVMFLDLDRFKIVNDALGHEAGDDLLVAIARRLEAIVTGGVSVARFGGDEFTVLASAVADTAAATEIARRIVTSFREPISVGDDRIVMSVSIGVVLSGRHTASASAMLRDADAAMYRAKHQGRNRVEVFDDGMRAVAVARLDLEHALRDSVERGDFALHYQPEVDLERLAVVGTEALLRWRHPVRGSVPPADFIPVAEETGAIVELGEWVLLEACRQLGEWDTRSAILAPRLWVNLSMVQLIEPGFVERVARLLVSTGTDPTRLGLEITESALMTDVDTAIESLRALRELGLGTAIDDFGTGYASLAYLRRLPVDHVKVDQTFVKDVVDRHRGAPIFSAIVELVHAAGATVIAEGVETEEQFRALRELGCDAAQGHWLGRPVHPDEAALAWTG